MARKSSEPGERALARYEVLWTSTAGVILNVSATSVIELAKRDEERFGQRVMWGRNDVNELASALVHADWLRERARTKFRRDVEITPHVMVLPVIGGLATVEDVPPVAPGGIEELLARTKEFAEASVRAAESERFERMQVEVEAARRDASAARADAERWRTALHAATVPNQEPAS